MAEIAVRDLVIEYRSGDYLVRPIDGLNLEVGSGELVLLLGASGSGKTTLLSALGSILTPTSGSIRVGDTDVVGLKGRALTDYRRRQIGIVFQLQPGDPSLSARETDVVDASAGREREAGGSTAASELLARVDTDRAGRDQVDQHSNYCSRSVRSTRASSSDARRRASRPRVPAERRGISTFSRAVRLGIRLKLWKTMPIWWRR